MKVFECDHCGNLVFFDNVKCLKCGHSLGFLPDVMDLTAILLDANSSGLALAAAAGGRCYRLCANGRDFGVCNWMIPVSNPNPLCPACELNDTIPNLSVPGNQELWGAWERAKHHAVYTLLRLGLPLKGYPAKNQFDLRFKFLSDSDSLTPVVTGHENGVITLNIAEGDDAEREKRRVSLHEPYRTLLGHFRHELGHYYWDRLIAGTDRISPFRELFGDESQDYASALASYYALGAAPDWQSRCVSAYATAHPWEDWAETWAHYLHITDTMETAASFGMSLKPRHPAARTMTFDSSKVSSSRLDFDGLVANWIPLTYALNSLNRGMGLHDLYPFVLSTPAVEKLRFIHHNLTHD